MYSLPKNVYRERIDFSKIKTTVPIPNLIEIQKKSYERFLQMNRLPSEREDAGLQSVFKSVFPISDFRENSSLEFIEYLDRQLGVQVREARRACITCASPAAAAARRWSPIPTAIARCCARAAARPTRRAATSATSAATPSP